MSDLGQVELFFEAEVVAGGGDAVGAAAGDEGDEGVAPAVAGRGGGVGEGFGDLGVDAAGDLRVGRPVGFRCGGCVAQDGSSAPGMPPRSATSAVGSRGVTAGVVVGVAAVAGGG